MQRFCFFILAFSLFSLSNAQAGAAVDSCASVDFRLALGATRNQGNTLAWCYAYTTADMITQRMGLPHGHQISAADLSATFMLAQADRLSRHSSPVMQSYLAANTGIWEKIRTHRQVEAGNYTPENILRGLLDTGGQEDTTLLLANLQDFCLEAKLPSREGFIRGLVERVRANHRRLDREYRRRYGLPLQRLQSDSTSAIQDPISVAIADSYHRAIQRQCGKRVKFNQVFLPQTLKFSETLELYKKKVSTGEIDLGTSQAQLKEAIDKALDRGRVAAIGYDAYSIIKREPADQNPYGDHSSIIAARRKIHGVCHYYLRNSWGDDCNIYQSHLSGACENGGVWLTLSQLNDSLYSVISIQ